MNKQKRIIIKNYLLEIFQDVEFYDPTHTYSLKSDRNYKFRTSCSSISKLFEETFDEDYWAKRKAKELKIPEEQIRELWKTKREAACEKGTFYHNQLEKHSIDNRTAALPIVKKAIRELLSRGYVFIAQEITVYDKELGLVGTIDALLYHIPTETFVILDWKTNSKPLHKIESYIDKQGNLKLSKFKMKEPFQEYPKSKYYSYCFQLSGYKLILERNTKIKISKLLICHINEEVHPSGFDIIELEQIDLYEKYFKRNSN